MCGIAGILGPSTGGPDQIKRMLSALHHRGPDESGIYVDPHITLGHTRLSIVGLGDGTQPISNEDETLWVVYNGEIFNFPELRSELEKKGHIFRSQTDTEALVHLYEDFGPDFLHLINGQFAFAIWNCKKRELFLARDRVGIRPLFYWRRNETFIFASEIKALFQSPEVPREIDLKALHQVFTFWTTLPPRTMFRDIHDLPPGHYMVVNKDGEEIQRFWDIPYYSPADRWQGSLGAATEKLRELLIDAVRIRLRADVPVGAYLSGGLDSSIIASLIANNFNNNLRTFSLGFQDESFDESAYQRELVNHLGTNHRHIHVSSEMIRQTFRDVVWHCEKPVLRTAPAPMFMLSGLVRENQFKVVLTGEGADELFGGYNIFKEAKIRRFWGRSPDSQYRPLLLERLYPYIFKNPTRGRSYLQKFFAVSPRDLDDPLFSHRIRWENTGKNRLFYSAEVQQSLDGYDLYTEMTERLPADFSNRDHLAQAQYLEMDIFLSNYLLSSQGDRVAMGNSLELRLPFLDYRVIDFAMQLPPSWKLHVLNEKFILKKAFSDLVPAAILKRPKQPYRAPIREVFLGDRDSCVDDMLSENYLKRSGLFDTGKTGHLLDKFRRSEQFGTSETQNMALVGILSTQLLYNQFIDDFASRRCKPIRVDKIVVR
jgi:asparagine synthase (glutamine-hydrolysing)